MNVIYIGSGKSALQAKDLDLTPFKTICLNNAWRLLDNFDVWIRSGDFPLKNMPKKVNFKEEISYSQYSYHIKKLSKELDWQTNSPEHYVGYTMFFQGLYYIMSAIKPKNIYTLGFDHDYNVDRYNHWKNIGEPNPQNQFLNINIEKEFDKFEADSFYGKSSTPDPLRRGLGFDYLKDKFELAKKVSKDLNINLYNASFQTKGVNLFKTANLVSLHK